MAARFTGDRAAVMTDNAGNVYQAVVHPGRNPPLDRMARLAGIRRRNVILRFAGGYAAVMAGKTGVACPAVIDTSRFPCPGRVTLLAVIRCGHMAGRFAVNFLTVMAADANGRDTAMIYHGRQPFNSRVMMTGTTICRGLQMAFEFSRGNRTIMTFNAHVHCRLLMNKPKITILRVNMTFVA